MVSRECGVVAANRHDGAAALWVGLATVPSAPPVAGAPTILSLFVLLYPGADPSANERAGDQVLTHLEQVVGEVRQAAEQAKLWRCASGPSTTLSPYRRARERLFYQRVCVEAQQPTASLLASSAPGMIYIATSPTEQVVWLRATVLPSPATNIVRWLRVRSRESLLLAGSDPLLKKWPIGMRTDHSTLTKRIPMLGRCTC